MDPAGDLPGLIALLGKGGDVVLIFAAWVMWRTDARISKIEATIELLKAGDKKP